MIFDSRTRHAQLPGTLTSFRTVGIERTPRFLKVLSALLARNKRAHDILNFFVNLGMGYS